ncbi:MAG: NAD-dependent DNA ligase LigA [Candidatus Hermodarchaeota archaeon]
MKSRKERISELEEQIKYHNERYWIDNAPEISDEKYDLLKRELRKLDPNNPVLSEIAPIDLSTMGTKVEHSVPMLSLDKAYSVEEVMKWAEKIESELTISPKLDGLAVSIRYTEKGNLGQCSTRGNGWVGEDITAAAMIIKDIPKRLPAVDCPLTIRGEIYMRRSIFKKFVTTTGAASPRNLAAGTVKQKDIRVIRERQLSFAAYDVFRDIKQNGWKTEIDKYNFLTQQNVPTVETELIPQSVQKIEKIYQKYHDIREKNLLDYDIDGVVIKANDLAEQRAMGETRHHPRYIIALKFASKAAQTIVRELEWSLGRTGKIIPVAILEPVFLADANITRVTLHNFEKFEKFNIAPGDTVEITRSGDVIPKIEKVVRRSGKEPFSRPGVCPSCKETLFEEGPFLVCKNKHCKGSRLELLRYFISTLEIKGIGDKWIEKLFEEDLIGEPADFFKLREDQLLKLPRMGEKSAKNFVTSIQEKRIVPLEKFLQALGVPNLGPAAAEALVKYYKDLETIMSLTPEDLIDIEGFGEIIAQSVVEGLEERKPIIDNLLRYIRFGKERVVVSTDNPLANKTWCFTGTLTYYSRKEAEELIKSYGGRVSSTITKDLDILVIGEKPGSKYEKAQSKGIKIITENEFMELVSQAQIPQKSVKKKKAGTLDKFFD